MQTNAADRSQIKEAKLNEKEQRKRELEELRTLLTHHSFRRFYYRYLETCGVFRTSFTGSSETFFNEGRREIGLRLMADLNDANPDAYAAIIKENRKVNEN